MRVTITYADADNTQTPILAPPPFVSIPRKNRILRQGQPHCWGQVT